MFLRTRALSALLALGACATPVDSPPDLGQQRFELDDMGQPPAGMELFLLAPGADVAGVRETFERLHGTLLHELPPRLVVGKVPAGADAVLQAAGIIARYARAVSPDELSGLSAPEARFVRVFSNRYYPDSTRAADRVTLRRRVRDEGESFETEPPEVPRPVEPKSLRTDDDGAEQNERNVYVPYASGKVVVSIVLPESNGVGEPDSESWSEQGITEVYAKIQAAVEGIARHEPNAQLSFVMHYESSPADGGLEGTIDVDYEYGKQAWGGEHLNRTYAQIFSRLSGRDLGEFEYWEAERDYLAGLKERYRADAAFIVFVAANQNGTAGFRAYANINGPSTSLDSSYGYETFMHEFGHIFGALDEYCPDACIHPSSLAGYLGVVNANAQYRAGAFGGIRGGRGESQGSLMMYNVPNGVNGYTRGAWGWLDTDGDGVMEVRDTRPKSELSAALTKGGVHLVGRVVDVPATPNWAIPYSENRIVALHVRRAGSGAWVRLPVGTGRRGREDVDLSLGQLARGHYALEVRAENSVGNLEHSPSEVIFDVNAGDKNAAPLVSLASDLSTLSPAGVAGVTASVLDLDGDAVNVRFDLDGDGRFDTPFGGARTVWVTPPRAGRVDVRVEARDRRGATATATLPLYVLEHNAPARPGLPAQPSPLVGDPRARLLTVGEVNDPERGAVQLNTKLERDDYTRSLVRESGFGPPRAHVFDVQTPVSLASYGLDLASLDGTLERWTYVYDAVFCGQRRAAFALGDQGVAFVDLANRSAPRLVARLSLETPAYDLGLAGSTLFVTGNGQLSVVDLSAPEAPSEIRQAAAAYNTRLLQTWQPTPIDEQGMRTVSMWAGMLERIDDVRVELDIDHPHWEQLRVELVTTRGDAIVLWDHQPAPAGQTRVALDEESVPALAQLAGMRASGEFRLEISDDVADGSTGSFSALITLETVSRAFQPASYVQSVVGVVDGSLVLAGTALETVDVSRLDALRTQAVLATEYVQKAELVGRTVVGVTAYQDPAGDGRPRGLFAVDVEAGGALRTGRVDDGAKAEGGFAIAGSRLYLSSYQAGGTRVGSLPAFLRGEAFWLGQSPLMLGADLAGDDRTVWVAHGPLERVDVQNPAALTVLERFEDPYAYTTRFFDAQTAVLLGSAGELALVDLSGRVNVLSEVYRITAQARDAQGAESEVSRTVHVVPYDHPPVLQSARFRSGATTADWFELEVVASDPDQLPSWDSYLAVRIDWDGDGNYDGPWLGLWEGAFYGHMYERPGDYLVRVQVRDGFYALSHELTVPVHVAE